MRLLALLAALAAVLALAGCGATVEQRTAEQVMRDLVARVEHAKPGVVFTAETDPNDLLGRPGGYTSKATFVDTRVAPGEVVDDRPGSVDLGGSIEVFVNADDAQARAEYVGAITRSVPAFAEYQYRSGAVLLRVSGQLTPDQAAAYETALAQITD